MRKIYYYFIGLLLLLNTQSYSQAIHACFTEATGQAFPVQHCGAYFMNLTNCSTGSYDSAVWKYQISNNYNCTGPWGISFTTSKTGAQAITGTGFSLTLTGSHKVCLFIYNHTTGQVDSFCQCISVVYPIPIPTFTATDSSHCGGLTTTFVPNIQSGTPPYGPITWFFGDNATQTTAGVANVSHTYACKSSAPPCYSVTISIADSKGCSKVVTKPCMINVPCKPTATVAVTGGSACTTPTSLTFTATPSLLQGHGIYTWWFPPTTTPPFLPSVGPSSSASSATQNFTTFGCKNVVVALKDSATGCTDTVAVNNAVCIQGITVTSLSASASNICCGAPFGITFNASSNPVSIPACNITGNLVATPVGGGTPIALGAITSGTTSFYSIPCVSSTAVTYNICFQNGTITNQCNNCTQTYNGCFQVTVNPSPTAHINLTAPTLASYCSKGHQFCFNASTPANNLPGCNYTWTIGSRNGTALSTTTSFCNTFANFGTYKIFLRVCQSAANGGCCAYDSITVSQVPPVGSFSISNTQGCGSVCAKFTVSPATDSLYIYNFGDGTITTSTVDTIRHCFQSNVDTCFTITIIHIAHSVGGFACVDTLKQKGAIKIGHKIIPSITMSPPVQCLIHKVACVSVNPNNPGLIPPAGASTNTCLTKACHWYFTKPGDPHPVVQSYVCDSPKVCFDDTGHFDAHYVIINNTCADTIFVPNAVIINGVVGDFTDSFHCSTGTLSNFCVTIKSNIKVYPYPPSSADSTHIKFIVNNGSCGVPTIYNFSIPRGAPVPTFNHCFCGPGSYTITMITSNSSTGCPPDTTVKTFNLSTYHAQLDFNPSATSPSVCFPHNLCFTSANSVPSNPDKITWSFGDGATSTSAYPCHYFDTCGVYTVKLKLSDNSGTCTDSTTKVITVHDFYPNISAHVVSPCSNCMKFTNTSQFCNGSLASTVIYLYKGSNQVLFDSVLISGPWSTYTYCSQTRIVYVNYKLTDNFGCSKTVYFPSDNPYAIIPCLSGLVDTAICVGTQLNLSECSSNNWLVGVKQWTLSQGACNPNATPLSTTSSFNYTFSTQGYYYLNLHLSTFPTGVSGGCTADTCIRIHVQNPIAGFTGRDTIPCPGSFDTLINTTTGAYNTLVVSMSAPAINFYQTFTYSRAGGTGTIPNQVLLPLGFPADYKICWNAISSTGCSDSICKNLHVAGPIGHLSCSNVYVCMGDTVCCTLTTNSSRGPIIRFSDGSVQQLLYSSGGVYNFCHKYVFPGNQLVQAFIDDGVGCGYPLSDTVHVDGPLVKFTWTPYKKDFCGPATVTMLDSTTSTLYPIDTATYKWIVIDSNGNVFATYAHKRPTIHIATPGSYSIMEIVKTTHGCVDTLKKSFINIYQFPTAQFNSSPDTICVNQCVNYTNTSNNPNPVALYSWLLNYPTNQVYSTATNTQFCYSTPGTFQSILIDSSIHGCVDTSSIHTILVLPSLSASFAQNADTICGNTGTVAFNSTSTPNSGITWEWNFGDGTGKIGPGNFPSPSHLFTLPTGVKDTCFVVKMIIRNSSGCIDSTTHTVCISAIPQIGLIVSKKISCNPLVTVFTDSSISLEPIISYVLDYGDGSPVYNSSVRPTSLFKTYTNASHSNVATYISIYTIKTQYGCINTLTDTFVVNPVPQAAFVEDNDSLCGNSGTVNFSSSSIPNTGLNYSWNFGDGSAAQGPSSTSSSLHVYHLPNGLGTDCFPAQLNISNTYGCIDSSAHTICISANPQPIIVIGPSASCNPLLTSIKDSSNSLVTIVNYVTDFGDGSAIFSSPSAPNISHTYTNSSNTVVAAYPLNYSVTTTFGCKVSLVDTFKVYPIPVACVGTTDSVCPAVSTTIGCAAIPGMHYHWFSPTIPGTFAPYDSFPNPIVAPIFSTTYSLAVVNQYGCRDTDSVHLFVKSLVVPYAGRDTSICEGGYVHLFAQGGNTYAWYQVKPYTFLTDSASFIFQPATPGGAFEAIINGDCNTDSATVNVNVFPKPGVKLAPSTAPPIIAGQNYNLVAIPSGLGILDWHPNVNINCDTCSSVVVSPDVNTTYTVTITDVYGCKDSAEITIYVLCDKSNSIYVPNAFEPSLAATSRNAYFYVQGTGIKELTFMRVYNRWGTEVFYAEHVPINKPEFGWDGTFNGTKVNIDVYMYQLQVECSNGNTFPISGNVTVIK